MTSDDNRKKLAVNMSEILDAMDGMFGQTSQCFLDLQAGEVLTRFGHFDAEDLDEEIDEAMAAEPDRYEEIAVVSSHEQYRWMEGFAREVDEEDISEKLWLALDGKGAFGRFNGVVRQYPDLNAQWERAKQQRLLQEALDWLDGLGIEPQYQLRPILPAKEPGHADPRPTTKGSKIGLLEILLLGAPEGKTELIDGRVSRLIVAPDPSAARKIFKQCARDLCDFYGIAWRKKFIQGGASRFEREEFLILQDDCTVEVSVAVSGALWNAFCDV